MNTSKWVWELTAEDKILGTLTTYGWYDFPWIGCKFEPTTEFETYRHFFNESLKFLEMGDIEKLDILTEQINHLIKLMPINDETPIISEYSLYIEEDDTRLRAIFADNSTD